MTSRGLLLDLRSRRFGRFSAVPLLSLLSGHVLLYSLHVPAGLSPLFANFLATAVNTAFVFWASRRWVWSVDGDVSFRRESLPFVVIALAGLGLSSVVVALTAAMIGEGLWVNLANMTAFGIVWIFRSFFFDRWAYAPA